MIADNRGVSEPHYSLSVDAGGEKLVLCLQVYDQEAVEDEADGGQDIFKESGSRRTVVISAIDKCEENRENIEAVLEPAAALLARDDIDLNADMKGMAEIHGWSLSCNTLYYPHLSCTQQFTSHRL